MLVNRILRPTELACITKFNASSVDHGTLEIKIDEILIGGLISQNFSILNGNIPTPTARDTIETGIVLI